MRIQQALADVARIRAQLNKATEVRCFRSQAVGVSALLVVVGAIAQANWVDRAAASAMPAWDLWLLIWLIVAFASSLVAGLEMVVRGVRSESRQVWETHGRLVRRVLPSLMLGCVLTAVVASQANMHSVSESLLWALPGLWAMVYAVGLLACEAVLPTHARLVAIYYFVAGGVSLVLASSLPVPPGWHMVMLFGVGQFLLGWVLLKQVETGE